MGIKTQHRKKGRDFGFFFFLVVRSLFSGVNLSRVYLFETDWANVQTKLLLSSTNVQRCNVEDGKARRFICSVLDHCLAPFASVSLRETKEAVSVRRRLDVGRMQHRLDGATHSAAVLQHREGKAAVALSPQLHVVGALEHHSLLHVASLTIHVSDAVPAVVGDVLARLVGQQAHEGQLGGHALWAERLIVVGEL